MNKTGKAIILTMLLATLIIGISLHGWSATNVNKEEIVNELQKADIDWTQFSGEKLNLLMYTLSWQAQIEDYIPIFEELTGIKVNTEVYQMPNMRQKRSMDLMTKAGQYDLWYFMPIHHGLGYYYSDWVEPLKKYVSDENLTDQDWFMFDDFFDSGLNQGTYEGELVYIPTTLDTLILAYRKDLFEEYGIEVPSTWKEVWEAAEKLNLKEENTYGIVLRGEGYSAVTSYAPFFRSLDGEWLNPPYYKPGGEIPEPAFVSEAGIKSLEFYSGILRKFGPPGIASYTWEDRNQFFMNGNAAMLIGDNIFVPGFEDPETSKVAGKLGYAAFPKTSEPWAEEGVKDIRKSVAAGAGLAISSMSDKKEAAWLFIEFASSPIISKKMALTGMPMARESLWKDEDVIDSFPHPDFFEASLITYKTADPHYMPRVRSSSEVREAIGTAISKALEGKDIEDALSSSASRVEKIIEEEVKTIQ